MATVRILIVEDEIIVAQDIAARLERAGYEVVALVDTGEAALETLRMQQVDLALLDINLIGDLDGIATAQKIRESHRMPMIYLTSLSDRHTVERARATQPSAYMLKPFNDRELEIAIDMAVANFSTGREAPGPAATPSAPPVESGHFFLDRCMFIKDQYRYQRVDLADLLWAEASGNYTQLVTQDKTYLLTAILSKIEERLPSPPFLRVHRSFLVNVSKVDAFEGNRLFIGNREIPVSKASHDAVFRHFPTL